MKLEIDKILDLDALKETFIVSNTPLYMYKNFRKNGTVQELSNRYSSDILINFFESAINKNDSLARLVSIYSIIIALTFKDYSEVHHFFNKLDSYDLEWSKELKEIFMSSVEITQIYRMNENYRVKSPYDFNSEQSSTSLVSEISRPKISVNGESI